MKNGKRTTSKKIAKKKKGRKVVEIKMQTYVIAVRRRRTLKWKITPDKVTASSKVLAAHIAAHKNPNLWVRVIN